MALRLIFLAMLAILLGGCSGSVGVSDTPEAMVLEEGFKKASEYFREGDTRKGRMEVDRLVVQFSENWRVASAAAAFLAANDQLDKAVGIAARTVKNSAHYNQPRPMNRDDLVKLAIDAGMLAYSNGQKDLSAQMMEIALELEPDNAIAANGVAWDLAVRGKELERAMQLVDIALKKEPRSAAYIDTKGWIYYQMGDYQQARKWLESAVRRDPNHPELRYNLARAHWASEYHQGAYVEARKALILNPHYAEARELMREIRKTYSPHRGPSKKADILTWLDHAETPVD